MCFLLLELDAIPRALPPTDDVVSCMQNKTHMLMNVFAKALMNVLTNVYILKLKFGFKSILETDS